MSEYKDPHKEKSREQLIVEFADYTVDKMELETLKRIAAITLMANVNPESDWATWHDYLTRAPSLQTAEELLGMIQPSVIMKQQVDESKSSKS